MEAKEGLELIKLVIDETVAQLGADPLIKISAQLAATKMLKISFKAGEEVGFRKGYRHYKEMTRRIFIPAAKQAGIREVVELVESQTVSMTTGDHRGDGGLLKRIGFH